MFPYAPTTQDTSGQIQAEYNYKGATALNNGIASAASSIGSGLEKGISMGLQKGLMDRATLDMNLGKMDAYRQANIMDEATYTKFVGMGVQKQSGALAGFDATVVNPYIKSQEYQNMMQAKQMYGQGPQAANTGSPISF